MEKIEKVLELLGKTPSVFHAVANMKKELLREGYEELEEGKPFDLLLGGKYFLTRNGSSLIAFVLPSVKPSGFRLAVTHNDSPSFAVKPNPVLKRGGMSQINVEPYGGAIYYTWLDRALSFAGRVYCKTKEGIVCSLVDVDEDVLVIPSLAIHQNREVNKGYEFNPAKDMVPLWMDKAYEGDFNAYLQKKCSLPGEVLSHDLFLYVREKPRLVGEGGDMVLSPRLDDLSSAYANLLGFIEAGRGIGEHAMVFASFDNEEVGSLTAQGANSDFLRRTLDRLMEALGLSKEEQGMALAASIMLSVDNAHANHPNHLDKCDPTTEVRLNGGIVIKRNAAQKYTTNATSEAYVKSLCAKLGQPCQMFTNRSDMPGGSTLGNISNAEVSLLSADIGIAQLAMHSCVELCGKEDIARMVDLLRAHYLG